MKTDNSASLSVNKNSKFIGSEVFKGPAQRALQAPKSSCQSRKKTNSEKGPDLPYLPGSGEQVSFVK